MGIFTSSPLIVVSSEVRSWLASRWQQQIGVTEILDSVAATFKAAAISVRGNRDDVVTSRRCTDPVNSASGPQQVLKKFWSGQAQPCSLLLALHPNDIIAARTHRPPSKAVRVLPEK